MTEDRSSRYHRLRRRVELAALAWTALLMLGLLATGAAQRLRDLAAALAGGAPATTAALVAVTIGLLHEVGALPLAWYGGHALERRYGLTTQRAGQWAVDHAKAVLLGLTLAASGASIVYALLRVSPAWWWLYAAGILTALLAVLAALAPLVLLPLFFRFTPLTRQDLRARLEAMAARTGTRVLGVYEWALGAKTKKANAALTGIGRTRRILISDTMLAEYPDDQIEVVLAHELAHHVHRDIWTGLAVEAGLLLAGLFATHVAIVRLAPAAGLLGPADPAGLPLLVLAAGGVSVLLLPVALAISRRHERRADRFALETTRNPYAFIAAMRRLGAQNLAEERPSRLVQWLFYSHPPLAERVAAAQAWARGQGITPPGGGPPRVAPLSRRR